VAGLPSVMRRRWPSSATWFTSIPLPRSRSHVSGSWPSEACASACRPWHASSPLWGCLGKQVAPGQHTGHRAGPASAGGRSGGARRARPPARQMPG
jgi:hypothetical protein